MTRSEIVEAALMLLMRPRRTYVDEFIGGMHVGSQASGWFCPICKCEWEARVQRHEKWCEAEYLIDCLREVP